MIYIPVALGIAALSRIIFFDFAGRAYIIAYLPPIIIMFGIIYTIQGLLPYTMINIFIYILGGYLGIEKQGKIADVDKMIRNPVIHRFSMPFLCT